MTSAYNCPSDSLNLFLFNVKVDQTKKQTQIFVFIVLTHLKIRFIVHNSLRFYQSLRKDFENEIFIHSVTNKNATQTQKNIRAARREKFSLYFPFFWADKLTEIKKLSHFIARKNINVLSCTSCHRFAPNTVSTQTQSNEKWQKFLITFGVVADISFLIVRMERRRKKLEQEWHIIHI